MLPTIAPVKKAPKSHTAVHGQPNKLPRNSASFTSPKPIPFPKVKICIRSRNAPALKPANK